MKTILGVLILWGTLILSLAGCDNFLSSQNKSSVEKSFDNDGSPTILLKFDRLVPITSLNSDDYTISGKCDPVRGSVTVVVETLEETFDCDESGVFSGSLDVSTITTNPPSIQATQGNSTISLEGNEAPVNDQEGPASAPTATAPSSVVPLAVGDGDSLSYDLTIDCNEEGEIIEISGSGVEADQTYTCLSENDETFTLTLTSGVELSSPNNLTLSSTDKYENPAGATTSVDVPIDTQGPRVAITNLGNIIQGQSATFTITATDGNEASSYNYTVNTSGTETASYNCTANPCDITTSAIATAGDVVLTVTADSITDDLENTGDTTNQTSTVTAVAAGALNFNTPLITINTLNASNYTVAGVCDSGLGDVSITVDSVITETASCTSSAFTKTLDLTSVTSGAPSFTVSQALQTHTVSPSPINDQTPITNTPDITDVVIFSGGTSTTLSVTCNEANETLNFSGSGLIASQTYTCASTTPASIVLNFASNTQTGATNTITISSEDVNGNPTTNNSTFNLPIDNVAPTVSVAAGASATVGGNAHFTITMTDSNLDANFTPTVNSGTVSSGACTASPCAVTVTGFSQGTLTLTVASGDVADLAGNTNTSLASADLSALTSNLSVNPLPMATSLNAAIYPVSGTCESTQGNISLTIGTPDTTKTGVKLL